jgi:hypothetical protein
MNKNDKPIYYTALTVLVEMEVRANSQAEANAILRHKMQTFVATNPDLALHQMVSKSPTERDANIRGFDLIPLP